MTLLLALSLSALAAPPEVLLADARELARHGDLRGARGAAEEALTIPGDHQRQAQLIIAMTMEMGDDPAGALALYDALQDAWPAREAPCVLALRRGGALARLHQYSEARRAVRPALRRGTDTQRQQARLDRALWDLELHHERRGLKALQALLNDPNLSSPWIRGQIHTALAQRALDQALALSLEGSAAARAQAITHQAALIGVAREQASALIRLEQVSMALQILTRLGEAHERIGESLWVNAQEWPQALRRERVQGLWRKSALFYDRAYTLASSFTWEGAQLATLQQQKERMQSRVDQL